MPQLAGTCPMTSKAVVDAYFLEHRAKLIDVAAFLDRVERAAGAAAGTDDFRTAAFRAALAILLDGKPDRARRVLEHFSDPTAELIPAAPMKGASGAYAANAATGAKP